MTDGRGWAYVVVLVGGVPLLALCALTLPGPPTPETIVFTTALLSLLAAAVLVKREPRLVWAARGGGALMAAVVIYRLVVAADGVTVRGSEAPFGGGTRWLDRIVPERDLAIGGSTALMAIGAMGAEEDDLHGALRDGYDRMRATEGPIPSPILSTMLWGQRPGGHSMIAIDPPGDATSAVVFLHGFMGNITIACWHVAQAATAEGVAVMCPSTGWRAHWSGSDGLATVASTIDTLRRRGMKRIYLAGLSSGAIGASLGASMLDVDGVILISGAAPEAVPKRVPTLVLQGANDPRTRPGPARAYAQKLGDLARYIEHPEAGHWMILAEHVFVTEHIRGWLREQGPRD